MRKFIFILIGLTFFTFAGCNEKVTGEEKIAVNYIKQQGYKLISEEGQLQKYTLKKSQLYGKENMPNMQVWALQKAKPEDFIEKEITVYGFIVKNHPEDKLKNSDKYRTVLRIMMCENKIIGGTSGPEGEYIGGALSIDGKTIEEVTGLTYIQWFENWKKKYGDQL